MANARWSNKPEMELQAGAEVARPVVDVNPYVSAIVPPNRDIDQCRYDRQSNYSMQRRKYVYPVGAIGVTWMKAINYAGFNDPGTSYNYYDGRSWGQWPTGRIEGVRIG